MRKYENYLRGKDSLNVTTDSRKVVPGCIFVALKGEHFDGNDFVEQARQAGAEYIISGENALAELQDLARAWRRELGLPVLGITGTNGKTTTKELCAAVLSTRYNLYYTQGNLNNQLGVPLTLLSITRAHEMAIVEMGASHPGDIKELVEIAEPDYGLITNVGKAHLQGFGSFEGVMRTKAELYDFLLAHNGTVFRNADNPYLEKMYLSACKASGLSAQRSGSHLKAVCQAKPVLYHMGSMPEGTHLVGGYNAENISAAIAVGGYFGVSEEDALAAIRAYIPSNNRSQLMQTERNTLVVDAYNANPTSMTAAINAFTSSPTAQQSYSVRGLTAQAVLQRSGLTGEAGHETPRCFILGAMRELGEYSHTEHQNIVNMLLERKADKVLLVGNEYKDTTAPYPVFENVEALCEYLQREPLGGYTVLLKGSRSNQLEKAIPFL